MSEAEQFQNRVLRPILKFQHPLLILRVQTYLQTRKGGIFALSAQARQQYLENSLQQDHKLRTELIGLIVGQFTVEEYQQYAPQASALNKRILSMLQTRVMGEFSELG
jgi:hypothetical protein